MLQMRKKLLSPFKTLITLVVPAPGACIMKLIMAVIYGFRNKL
jgi:hypothetical protein